MATKTAQLTISSILLAILVPGAFTWNISQASAFDPCDVTNYENLTRFVRRQIGLGEYHRQRKTLEDELQGDLYYWLLLCYYELLSDKERLRYEGQRTAMIVETVPLFAEFSLNRTATASDVGNGFTTHLDVTSGRIAYVNEWRDQRVDSLTAAFLLGINDSLRANNFPPHDIRWSVVASAGLFQGVWRPPSLERSAHGGVQRLDGAVFAWYGSSIVSGRIVVADASEPKNDLLTVRPPARAADCHTNALLFPFDKVQCVTHFQYFVYGNDCARAVERAPSVDVEYKLPSMFFRDGEPPPTTCRLENVSIRMSKAAQTVKAVTRDREWTLTSRGVVCFANPQRECLQLACFVVYTAERSSSRYLYAWFVATNLLAASTTVGFFLASRRGERFSYGATMLVPFSAFIFTLQESFPRDFHIAHPPLLPLYLLLIFANALVALLCANFTDVKRPIFTELPNRRETLPTVRKAIKRHITALTQQRRPTAAMRWRNKVTNCPTNVLGANRLAIMLSQRRRVVLLIGFLASQALINGVCMHVWTSGARRPVDLESFVDKRVSSFDDLFKKTRTAAIVSLAEASCQQRELQVSQVLRDAYEGASAWESLSAEDAHAFLVPCRRY